MTSSPPRPGVVLLVIGSGLGLVGLGALLHRTMSQVSDAPPPGPTAVTSATGRRESDVLARRALTSPSAQPTTGLEAYDPTRPGHGGPAVAVQPARVTAWLERRRQPLPLCSSENGLRASGTCQTTLARGGSRALVAMNGTVSIDEQGVVHVERGEATITNELAERVLVVVDSAGRTFRVAPLGKVDVAAVAPQAASNPVAAPGGPPVDDDPRTGPPRRDQPPPDGPKPGPPHPVLAPEQDALFGDHAPAPAPPPADDARPPAPPHDGLTGDAPPRPAQDDPGAP